MCFEELSSRVILIETKDKFVSSEFISEITVSTKAARLSYFDFPLLYGLMRGLRGRPELETVGEK